MFVMKLRDGFITYTTEEEQIMVAAGPAADVFHGMVRSNKTAAFIIDCLKNEIEENQLIDKLCEKYDAPRQRIAGDVASLLNTMRQIGALDE
jgi:hypothetical protein